MSSPNVPTTTSQTPRVDPKRVELVRKIRLKTAESKIRWNKGEKGYGASVGGKVVASFVMNADFSDWTTFVVRSEEGSVLTVSNPGSPLLKILAGYDENPLHQETDALYALVAKTGEGIVERAIRVVDGI